MFFFLAPPVEGGLRCPRATSQSRSARLREGGMRFNDGRVGGDEILPINAIWVFP